MKDVYQRFTPDEVTKIIEMWRAGDSIADIATVLDRDKRQCQDKMKWLRANGVNLPIRVREKPVPKETPLYCRPKSLFVERQVVLAASELAEAREAKAKRLKFPDSVRFEDHPNAKPTNNPKLYPIPARSYYPCESTLSTGARLVTGRKGG